MVVEVGADAGRVGDHIDAVRAEQLCRAEAGELEELR